MDATHAMNRMACHRHFLRRACLRGIALTAQDIVVLEETIEKMRPCFEDPSRARHRFRLQHGGERLTVVYDDDADAVLTVWRTLEGKRV